MAKASSAASIPETCAPDAAPASNASSMTAAERRVYSRMADTMSYYHNHFKSTWKTLYTACEKNKRPAGMSIKQYLNTACEFVHHLEMHHSIEERHIFPLLAQRMPVFQREMELLEQHKRIHKGIDALEKYVNACKAGERELRLEEMKDVLDGFREVLWQHLDEEVRNLGADNMKKYWTIQEMERMPM
ncbi:uncharacterized protein KY384_007754 [Bacidia gigantensis]|uniref:uncharacterized protein n=1 Tax=Bacidia gigantensis TaxID=2732470 RepID=UPI001D0388B8|nr:uncharacterized protein KY384_007754 [Bacidia gigantensis]KAG8527601.1 hypothetical protein KY384_007754 [Bacidia gigantensis]